MFSMDSQHQWNIARHYSPFHFNLYSLVRAYVYNYFEQEIICKSASRNDLFLFHLFPWKSNNNIRYLEQRRQVAANKWQRYESCNWFTESINPGNVTTDHTATKSLSTIWSRPGSVPQKFGVRLKDKMNTKSGRNRIRRQQLSLSEKGCLWIVVTIIVIIYSSSRCST